MSVFDGIDSQTLLERYYMVMKQYCELAQELAPKLEKFGKQRQELQELTVEFANRGVKPDDSQSLSNLIMQEIQKRENAKSENKTEWYFTTSKDIR